MQLLEQLNEKINMSVEQSEPPALHDQSDVLDSVADRSKLDDSVLESLSELLKRGGGEIS